MTRSIIDSYQKNVALRQHGRRFSETFGVPLASYFDNLLGFDIVKFDDEIVQPHNPDQGRDKLSSELSMKEIIAKQWGDEAVELIQKLIS